MFPYIGKLCLQSFCSLPKNLPYILVTRFLYIFAQLNYEFYVTTTFFKVLSQVILPSSPDQLDLLLYVIHLLVDILHFSLPLNWIYFTFQYLLFLWLVQIIHLGVVSVSALGIETALGLFQADLLVDLPCLLPSVHE